MISVIIPHHPMADDTKHLCSLELAPLNHEIILADNWVEGFKQSHGDFISFIEPNVNLSPGYFSDLTNMFEHNIRFRKLAMVCPSLGVINTNRKVFGYLLCSQSVAPKDRHSSIQPYLIQIGYVPGSVIRRSALSHLVPDINDEMVDSANICIFLWKSGNRIMINPDVTYVSPSEEVQYPFEVDRVLYKDIEDVVRLWRQEVVG